MFDVNAFLDRAKAAAGVTSDYALGVKVLGLKHTTNVTNWRKGRALPDIAATLKLCALTGDDPEHVVACLQSMRAANEDEADFWRHLADRLRQSGQAAVAFVVGVAALAAAVLTEPVQAAPDLLATPLGVCVLCQIALARLLWRLYRAGQVRVRHSA
jgi:hypothetical protein